MNSNIKEYFNNGCYFKLEDNGEKLTLHYSIGETLTESKKKTKKVELDKSKKSDLKKVISKNLKSKEKPKESDVKKELDELIDSDGTFLNSKVPFLNMALTPHKTMDQTISMSRVTNDPVTRGYRVYWGESEEKTDDIISEIDYSDAFGYDETENKDFKGTVKTLKNMGVDNAVERAKQFGKLPKEKVKKDKKGKKVLKQRLVEKSKLEEIQRQKMIKMVEDILVNKKKDKEVSNKEKPLTKILMKNIRSIKKLAEKEGIDLTQLIKALQKDE
jgi:hypothetical protein